MHSNYNLLNVWLHTVFLLGDSDLRKENLFPP